MGGNSSRTSMCYPNSGLGSHKDWLVHIIVRLNNIRLLVIRVIMRRDFSDTCSSLICDASCWANTNYSVLCGINTNGHLRTVRGSHVEIRIMLKTKNLHLTLFVYRSFCISLLELNFWLILNKNKLHLTCLVQQKKLIVAVSPPLLLLMM